MEIQTHPYEILVRFNCEPGEVAGAIRGMHLISGAYAVDDGGKIIGAINRGAEDLAKPAAQDQIAQIIGASAVATDIARREEVAKLNSQIEALVADLDKTSSALDGTKAAFQAATDALSKANAALDQANLELADLRSKQAQE